MEGSGRWDESGFEPVEEPSAIRLSRAGLTRSEQEHPQIAADVGSGHIDVDASGLPVLRVRAVGTVSDDQFRTYLDQLSTCLGRGKRVGVFDISELGRTPPAQRRMQIAWLHRHREVLAEEVVGTAFVIRSPVVRGVLTAVLWAAPLPGEQVVVASVDEALEWAHALLRDAGIAHTRAG